MKWEMVKLGKICGTTSGGTPSRTKNEFWDNGNIPWIKSGQLKDSNIYEAEEFITPLGLKNSSSKLIPAGTLLLALYGATAGKLGFLEIEATLNQAICALTPNESLLSNRYLFYYLLSIRKKIIEDSAGGAQPNISQKYVQEIEIPLPPLSIQQKIAAILDKADALRRKDQELLKKYDDLAQAIFIDMFGDPVRNEKGWESDSFENLFETRLGKMLDAKKQNGNFKYKYLGNSNVQWFKFNLENLAEMEFDEKDIKIFSLRKGDILICEGGEVGRAAIWNDEMQNVFFQKAIHRARIKTDYITPEFTVMLFWFLAKYGGLKDYVTTSTISHLTGEKLKTIQIPLPPYKQQVKFSQMINSLNVQRMVLDKSFKTTETLFQSLLQAAFKGELV